LLQSSHRLGERIGLVVLEGHADPRLPDFPLQVVVENVELVTFL
jgi:hypothetical protein